MQHADTVLGVLRERGRRGLSLQRLYRQLFNEQLFLMAYGRVYADDGAMTPGADGETPDGMSLEAVREIISQLRAERYRFAPVRRVHIPKKNGTLRPLGLPSWSDKLVDEVARLLLEAYYEPQFSARSHGFWPGRAVTPRSTRSPRPGRARPGSSKTTSPTATAASTTRSCSRSPSTTSSGSPTSTDTARRPHHSGSRPCEPADGKP